MPRPQKQGLDYFPLDVDFFADRKIKILKARYGSDGIMVYLYLLCEIYKNGYYIKMDEDYEFVIKSELNLSDNVVSQVMQFLVNRSLLTSILVNSDTYITSTAVQKRFQEVVNRRRLPVQVNEDLWLLEKEETLGCIKIATNDDKSATNPNKSATNPDKSETYPHSKEKESKVNKELLHNSAPCADKSAHNAGSDIFIKLPLNDKSLYSVSKKDIEHYKELYPAVNVEQELRNMLGWLEGEPKRRKTKNGIKGFITRWLNKRQDQGGARYVNQGYVTNNGSGKQVSDTGKNSDYHYRGEKIL